MLRAVSFSPNALLLIGLVYMVYISLLLILIFKKSLLMLMVVLDHRVSNMKEIMQLCFLACQPYPYLNIHSYLLLMFRIKTQCSLVLSNCFLELGLTLKQCTLHMQGTGYKIIINIYLKFTNTFCLLTV